jgi:subtilisin family serine protease
MKCGSNPGPALLQASLSGDASEPSDRAARRLVDGGGLPILSAGNDARPAPLVSGAAALVLQDGLSKGEKLTPAQVKQRLIDLAATGQIPGLPAGEHRLARGFGLRRSGHRTECIVQSRRAAVNQPRYMK